MEPEPKPEVHWPEPENKSAEQPEEPVALTSGGTTTRIIEEEIHQSDLFDLNYDEGDELDEFPDSEDIIEKESTIEERLKEKEEIDIRTLL